MLHKKWKKKHLEKSYEWSLALDQSYVACFQCIDSSNGKNGTHVPKFVCKKDSSMIFRFKQMISEHVMTVDCTDCKCDVIHHQLVTYELKKNHAERTRCVCRSCYKYFDLFECYKHSFT